jgi:holo-[acyl-carrier protein] synthase
MPGRLGYSGCGSVLGRPAIAYQGTIYTSESEARNLIFAIAWVCDSLIVSMIVGSGIDLAEIARIQHSIDRYGDRFLNRVFTAAEQAYCLRKRNSAESFAARFAAKEAAAKALGTGISQGVSWLEIEVVRERGGRPTLKLYGRAAQFADRLGVAHIALSITHTADLAMASVVLENLD